jgi:hypothetical protein
LPATLADFKRGAKAWLDKDASAEEDYFANAPQMLESLEQSLIAKGMSDHGMLEFLKDLWDELMIAYQTRNTFLIQLTTYTDMG